MSSIVTVHAILFQERKYSPQMIHQLILRFSILESFLLALAGLLKFYMDSLGVIYRCSPQESVKVNWKTCKGSEECEELVTKWGAWWKHTAKYLFSVSA